MHEQFHSPQLEARGYAGTYQDIWRKWLEDEGFAGQINEAEMNWLGSQGFTGTLNQRWYDLYYAAGLRGTLDDMGSKWIVPDGPPEPPSDGLVFDPTTTAELPLATDKIAYLTIISDALGTGTKTLVIKHTTSGDAWADGTIVYQGTVSGELIISNGELTFGEITSQTTALPADIGTGSTVWRITGAGGRYVQGPITLEI